MPTRNTSRRTASRSTARRAPARRPAARTTRRTSNVLVGRFGSEPIAVQITGQSTVLDVLQKAGLELQSSEHVWLNGNRTELLSKVKANDTINIVSPKQAGVK